MESNEKLHGGASLENIQTNDIYNKEIIKEGDSEFLCQSNSTSESFKYKYDAFFIIYSLFTLRIMDLVTLRRGNDVRKQ